MIYWQKLCKFWQEKNQKYKLSWWIFLVGFILVAVYFLTFIDKNLVDVPFWDQWTIVDSAINKNFDFFDFFLYQHNEHRIGVGLVIIKILSYFSHWSQVWEIRFIAFVFLLSAVVFSYLKYLFGKKLEILDITIPLIVLNVAQAENLTWGFQIAFVLPLLFLCFWLWALKIKDIRFRYLILTGLSFLSAFSSFHGLLLPFITTISVLLDHFKYKLLNRKILFLVIFTNIAIVGFYFFGFVSNFQTKTSVLPTIEKISYFSVAVSKGFFFAMEKNVFANYLITIIVLVLFTVGAWKIFKTPEKKPALLVGSFLVLYSLSFAYIISAGRSSFGIEQALTSRYVTFTMLTPLGLFFIISALKYKNLLKILLVIFIAFNLFSFTSKNIINPTNIVKGKRQALACYKKATAQNLDKCFEVFTLYPNKEYLNQRIIKVLRYKEVNEFIGY